MCRSTSQGGRRCTGSRHPQPTPSATPAAPASDSASAATGPSLPLAEPGTGLSLPPAEPGTGADWASAPAPEGMRPAGPRTTEMKPWSKMSGRYVPTDRELLAHAEEELATARPGTGEWAYASREADTIRSRAARGYHDGSLPELGHYRPVYFVQAERAEQSQDRT